MASASQDSQDRPVISARKKIIMVIDNGKCVSYIAVMIKDTAE